nr:hypothetical protein [uncultured Comamonas sp.]
MNKSLIGTLLLTSVFFAQSSVAQQDERVIVNIKTAAWERSFEIPVNDSKEFLVDERKTLAVNTSTDCPNEISLKGVEDASSGLYVIAQARKFEDRAFVTLTYKNAELIGRNDVKSKPNCLISFPITHVVGVGPLNFVLDKAAAPLLVAKSVEDNGRKLNYEITAVLK